MTCYTGSVKQRINLHIDIIRQAGLLLECYEWHKAGLTVRVLDLGHISAVERVLNRRIVHEGVKLQVFVKGPKER